MSSTEDILEDTRQYVIECSAALSELTALVGQLVIIERARAQAEGVTVEGLNSCPECDFPISTNRDICGDCKLVEAMP